MYPPTKPSLYDPLYLSVNSIFWRLVLFVLLVPGGSSESCKMTLHCLVHCNCGTQICRKCGPYLHLPPKMANIWVCALLYFRCNSSIIASWSSLLCRAVMKLLYGFRPLTMTKNVANAAIQDHGHGQALEKNAVASL